jgi:uncharacterized radical SAM superfamily Fe-S cluster-containing enzyme
MTCSDRTPAVPEHLERWGREHPAYLPHESKPAATADNATSPLDLFRLSLRRYDPTQAELPYEMLCECPNCDAVAPSTFSMVDDQLVLAIRCPHCSETRQAHIDTLWHPGTRNRYAGRAEATYTGSPVNPILEGLPRTVNTLCPTCSCSLVGRYYVKNGRVMIEKTCPEHGYFRDCVSSDVKVYLRATRWTFEEGPGLTNPLVTGAGHCPSDCGLCNQHQSHGMLAQIDLTNRCNLTCPVCFASANGSGRVYEPTFEEVEEQVKRLLDFRPIPCNSLQFTGGEPTIHPRFHDIVRRSRELGMSNIQIATNGITHANLEFAERSKAAGLHTLYMQFDGLDDKIYRKLRGRPLLEVKLQAIENCRKVGMKVCLVPTIIKGESSDQVPLLLDFAADNADVISGIAFQPVSFTGRISHRELAERRYTLGDLAHDIADHIGGEPDRDFFPLSFMTPLSNILAAVEKKPKITCTCHPDCSFGTYFFVAPKAYPGQPTRERLVPIPRVFNIPAVFTTLNEMSKKIIAKGSFTWWDKAKFVWMVWKNFNRKEAPPGMTAMKFIQAISGCVSKVKGRTDTAQKENYRTLMAAGMHFMDRYNFDVERARRCVIPYSTPEGFYPFCTHNCGPEFRKYTEAMHSVPIKEWVERYPGLRVVPPSSPNAVLPWKGRFGVEPDEDESWRTLRRSRSNLAELLPTASSGDNGKGQHAGGDNGNNASGRADFRTTG